MFHSQYEGINLLLSLSGEFKIDSRFCHYGAQDDGEFIVKREMKDLPDIARHNANISKALDFILSGRPSFAIIDKGRSAEEQSCIWVENGHFYGMGYIASDIGITDVAQLREYVTPYRSNQYLMQLIGTYTKKYPGKVFFPSALKGQE
jgi:DNA polymerase-3 subunit epsilon